MCDYCFPSHQQEASSWLNLHLIVHLTIINRPFAKFCLLFANWTQNESSLDMWDKAKGFRKLSIWCSRLICCPLTLQPTQCWMRTEPIAAGFECQNKCLTWLVRSMKSYPSRVFSKHRNFKSEQTAKKWRKTHTQTVLSQDKLNTCSLAAEPHNDERLVKKRKRRRDLGCWLVTQSKSKEDKK